MGFNIEKVLELRPGVIGMDQLNRSHGLLWSGECYSMENPVVQVDTKHILR